MMKKRNKRRNIIKNAGIGIKGSVCIFLALIMLPMMTLGGVILDIARVRAAEVTVESAAALAANSALAYYDRMLYDLYGIMAVAESDEELSAKAVSYFESTLSGSGYLSSTGSSAADLINTLLSSDTQDTGKGILKTESTGFSLEGIAASTPANPNILKREIVEYMKYRAPAELAKGLMTKISSLSNLSAQTKAVEKKLEYSKELDSLKDACEAAYSDISDFIAAADKSGFKNSSGGYPESFRKAVNVFSNKLRVMLAYMIGADSCSFTEFSSKGKLTDEEQAEYDSVKKDFVQSVNWLTGKINALASEEGIQALTDVYIPSGVGYRNISENSIAPAIEDISDALNLLEVASENSEKADRILLYCSYLEKQISSAGKEDKALAEDINSATGTRIKEARELAATLETVSGSCGEMADYLNSQAEKWGDAARASVFGVWYNPLEDIIAALEKASQDLQTILDGIDGLDSAKDSWKESIDALEASEIKAEMQGDYTASADDIDREAVRRLKNVIDGNLSHFKCVSEEIKGVSVGNINLSIDNWEGTRFPDIYGKISRNYSGWYSAGSGDEAYNKAGDILSADYNGIRLSELTPREYTPVRENPSDSRMDFWSTLVKMCGTKSSEDSESAVSLKDSLISFGSSESTESTTATLPEDCPGTVSESLPDKAAELIGLYMSSAEISYESFEYQNSGTDGELETAAASNLSSLTSLLSGIGGVLETGRDNLYTEEYLAGMFSCFADLADEENALRINGTVMSNTPYFGAELEYILWGNDSAKVNVNCTKSLIFGIRFALNTVYAMTSSSTRSAALTAATAIAGWSGFGVPIVENIILIAWSIAESIVDMTMLCRGESVALYKSEKTWYLGIGGLEKTLLYAAKNTAVSAAEDIFSKLEEAAVNGVSELESVADGYIDEMTDSVYTSVQDAFSVPVEALAQRISASVTAPGPATLESYIKETIGSIKGSCGGLTGECIDYAVGKLLSESVKEYAGKLGEIYEAAHSESGMSAEINELLYGNNGLISSLKNKITDLIKDKISGYADKYKDEIREKIQSCSDSVKSEITEKLDSFSSGISGDETSGKASGTAASGFGLTYKEYVKLFLLLHSVVSTDAMLSRAAELIQINMAEESDGFDLTKTYTFLSVQSEVCVATSFFSSPVVTYSGGESRISFNFENTGKGSWKLCYSGVFGF